MRQVLIDAHGFEGWLFFWRVAEKPARSVAAPELAARPLRQLAGLAKLSDQLPQSRRGASLKLAHMGRKIRVPGLDGVNLRGDCLVDDVLDLIDSGELRQVGAELGRKAAGASCADPRPERAPAFQGGQRNVERSRHGPSAPIPAYGAERCEPDEEARDRNLPPLGGFLAAATLAAVFREQHRVPHRLLAGGDVAPLVAIGESGAGPGNSPRARRLFFRRVFRQPA